MVEIFASSLLSLIAPWDRSRAVRLTRSPARCPRPVDPPPPPRRHSHPSAPLPAAQARPDLTHTSKLDLRQELLNTNVNIDIDSWLGCKFESNDEHRYDQDMPLVRSVSLDRGVEVFNYLQTVGSNWSGGSVGSTWTVRSYGRESVGRCRSVEDIPASQYIAKSRRASSDFDNTFGRNLALSVLRDSYRGIDMGSGSLLPQIKRLKWSYSLTKSFEDFKDAKDDSCPQSMSILESKISYSKSGLMALSTSNVNSDVEDYREVRNSRRSENKLRKKLSHQNLIQRKYTESDYKSDSDESEKESFRPYFKDILMRPGETKHGNLYSQLDSKNQRTIRKHLKSFKIPADIDADLKSLQIRKKAELLQKRRSFYRSVSMGSDNANEHREVECSPQKILGMSSHVSFVGVKKLDTDLRKEVLIRQNMSNFHSCEDILTRSHETRRRSIESKAGPSFPSLKSSKFQFRSDIQMLKSIPLQAHLKQATSVAKLKNINHTNTSNLVETGRKCDCRICMEEVREDRKSLIRRISNKLFMKIISSRNYGRKLTCWDENNNLNENEMYTCIMHILKLMLGLWLRHLDHN